jgi:hypothetical protein
VLGAKMSKNSFYGILLFLFMLLHSSCSQTIGQDYNKMRWSKLDTKALNEQIITALERWYADSSGCLKLRTGEDSDLLISTFGLDNGNGDSVITVLGQPNFTTEGVEENREGNEINVVRYIYFFRSECSGEDISPSSFISFIISTDTKQVIERRGGVY